MTPLRYVFVSALAVAGAAPAFATMPTLSDQPKIKSEARCDEWASNQDTDAIGMWGIQEDGSTLRASGLSRLSAFCQGYGTPEIVGFGSSIGFDEAFCSKHPDLKICRKVGDAAQPVRAKAACVVNDPTPTLLNYRTAPYGRILGTLDNGQGVSILDTTVDQNGKPWAYIADRDGNALGWVFRSYVLCR